MRITGITYVSRKTHKLRRTLIVTAIVLLLLLAAVVLASRYTNLGFVRYLEEYLKNLSEHMPFRQYIYRSQ
jgi:hypothetical protein